VSDTTFDEGANRDHFRPVDRTGIGKLESIYFRDPDGNLIEIPISNNQKRCFYIKDEDKMTLKIGLIGAGRIGKVHAETLVQRVQAPV